MKDRIKSLLQHLQVSSAEFADKLGVQRSSVSHILSGRNNPGLEFLQKILRNYPQVNPDWLLTGTGEMDRGGVIARPEDQAKPLVDTVKEDARVKSTKDALAVKDLLPVPGPGKPELDKIILLYKDGTFRVYHPADE